jgi:uncharacterized protein YcbK (DUF882 family)
MPEAEKMVDIDTSGPGAEVEIPEEKTQETEIEVANDNQDKNIESNKDDNKSDDSSKESSEQDTVQASESENKDQETKENKNKELEDYSDGVKRRIAKLTRKMREAERREVAALEYAKKVQAQQETLQTRYSKLDTGFISEMENRIKSSLEAAASN